MRWLSRKKTCEREGAEEKERDRERERVMEEVAFLQPEAQCAQGMSGSGRLHMRGHLLRDGPLTAIA